MYISTDHSIIRENGEVENLLNKDKFPLIENMPLEDLLLLDTINESYREKNFNVYNFYGMGVPRVSQILKECINKEYLLMWAAKIGQKEMFAVKNKATKIGTIVHEMIENFLINGNDLDVSYKCSPMFMDEILRAYSNFKDWIIYIESMGYKIEEIIALEKVVVCPLYGGTVDCIMKINGRVYLVDFKTSKQISYEYIIQVCSYMWIINNGYVPDIPYIDGIGIIRIDKEKRKFEDLFLNNHIPYQRDIINQYYLGFGSLLSCFYNNINMKLLFSDYVKNYKIEEVI